MAQDTLLDLARKAQRNAYAPYSDFPVGAALVTSSGRSFSGCNVENASLGLSTCAERNAIAQMVAAGDREIAVILVAGPGDSPLAPCGACRQVIAEFSGPSTRVVLCGREGPGEEMLLSDLLPRAFELK